MNQHYILLDVLRDGSDELDDYTECSFKEIRK